MTLHDIARRAHTIAINRKTGDGIEQARIAHREIDALIESGADINALENGKTALSILFEIDEIKLRKEQTVDRQASSVFRFVNLTSLALIRQGADPWAGDHCAWDQTLFSSEKLLLNRLFHGPPLRGPGGESDLHAYFRQWPNRPFKTSRIIYLEFSKYDATLLKDTHIDPDLLNLVDDAGLTPLHVLWQHPYINNEDIHDRFNTTCHVVKAGGKIDIPGPDGMSVADIISQHQAFVSLLKSSSLDHYRDAIGLIVSISDKKQLEQRTEQTVDTPSPRRRGL